MAQIAIFSELSGLDKNSGDRARRYARRLLAACLDDLGYPEATLRVCLCSSAEMRRMNKEFMGIDKPTDVLSFPSEDKIPKPGLKACDLGDIALSPVVAARNLKEGKRTLGEEVGLLLVHGLLHLLGHDHDTAPRKKEMWRETDRLLVAHGAKAPLLELKDQE